MLQTTPTVEGAAETSTPLDAEPTATLTPAPPPSPPPLPTAVATASPTAKPTVTPSPTPTPSPIPTATPDLNPFFISEVALNDIDDTPLQYLSLASHPFLDGSVVVHGTISLVGVGQPTDVVLEVMVSDVVIATGTLTESASAILLQPFDSRATLTIPFSQPLFDISPDQLALLDTSGAENQELLLRVRASASDGREAGVEVVRVQQLVRYTADNRYFVGEDLQGGNDWVLPSVRTLLEAFEGVQLGDISNMHGGSFPPHVTHQEGRDADLWFPGYNELDAAAAITLLALIDNPGDIERIEVIYVAYEQIAGNAFWSELEGVVLSDGRSAETVIQPEADHTGHFHLRLYR